MPREEQTKFKPSIRLACELDVPELAEIRGSQRSDTTGEDRRAIHDELDFLDRLALPHGDDYFCIVAEDDGRVVGYLIGGGSRDLDRKAHGEIYELAVLPAFRRRGVARTLLDDALDRFDAAAFAGTLISAPANDEAVRRLATGLEMQPDGHRDETRSIIRYERALRATARTRSTTRDAT